jgi:acetyl-CoA C-acetyltransferase
MRPDNLTVQMLQAVLAKVPELDPTTIDDLILGCGQPAGEAGNNLARAVTVLAGLDSVPGTTVNRYCSSSLQTTRMAFHAIKAGEGHAFVSAGVETCSRFLNGYADGWPGVDVRSPEFADALANTDTRSHEETGTWRDPRQDGHLPDVYAWCCCESRNTEPTVNVG